VRRSDFSRLSPGHLVPITVTAGDTALSHFAFVPDALPSEFQLDVDAWMAVTEAARRLASLNAVVNERFPNPQLLVRPTLRREAVSTSAIEGTFAPIHDVLRSELDETLPRTSAVQEVINFVRATEHAYKRRQTLPISSRFACELHRILFAGTDSEDWQTGQIRKTQVFIASKRGTGIRSAAYVPPPPGDELRRGLSQWEKWLHGDVRVHPIVKVAAAHYQFEALHPFTDGNGRIGRLLAVLQLVDYELLSHPMINLSPYFEARPDQYRTLMRNISKRGEWNEWFTFFCKGVSHQATEAEARVRAVIIWRDAMLERLRKHRVKGVAIDVVRHLIEHPTLSVQTIARRHKVSIQASNQAVARLTKLGVLRETSGKKYNRIFEAETIFKILLT
jgi:Fic family protein